MTTRGQILRSSTPGQVPAVNTRLPGEMWTTFPDLQLGVIDTAKTAQKLIAVRFFSTTANYVAGDFVVQGGKLYFAKASVPAGAFNATQWTQVAALTDIPALYVLPTASTSVLGGVMIDGTTITINSGTISSAGLVTVSATAPSPVQNGALWYDLVGGQLYAWVNDGTSSQWVVAVNQSLGGVYLPMTGGTLTGPLILAADPTVPLGAATKQYADKPTVGTTTNDNAAAGQVGEYILGAVGGGPVSSGALNNAATLFLTAGDWDVTGRCTFTPSGNPTISMIEVGLSTVSATLQVGGDGGGFTLIQAAFATGGQHQINTGMARYSLAVSTTIYAVAACNYTGGTGLSIAGLIWARRAR